MVKAALQINGGKCDREAAVEAQGHLYQVALDVSALDPNFKAHARRGIGRYVSALKDYFSQNTSVKLKVSTFDHQELAPAACLDAVFKRFPVGRTTFRQQVLYPMNMRAFRRRGVDLLHFPAHMDPPAWCPLPYIISVMDLIPLVFEDLYRADRPGWRFKLARFFEIQAIKNAAMVLVISECTGRDVHRILGVPQEKIIVTPLGVDQRFFDVQSPVESSGIREKFKIPEGKKIVLYVGGIDQRKNCLGLLEVFKRVVGVFRQRSGDTPVLLMAGDIQSDRQFPKLLAAVKASGLSDSVVMPGFVEDSDLLQLYPVCSAFCFLSLYEGFGLTPLEAMAAGAPVVSSNTSAMPEVLGDACLQVDPSNHQAAADALLQVLDDRIFAQSLIEKGRKQAAKFSWTRTGELTMQAYERFLTIEP